MALPVHGNDIYESRLTFCVSNGKVYFKAMSKRYWKSRVLQMLEILPDLVSGMLPMEVRPWHVIKSLSRQGILADRPASAASVY